MPAVADNDLGEALRHLVFPRPDPDDRLVAAANWRIILFLARRNPTTACTRPRIARLSSARLGRIGVVCAAGDGERWVAFAYEARMRMLNLGHKILLINLMLSSLLVTSYAQEPESQMPRKVDSYNDKIQSSEAEQWHLEDLREKLLKEPNTKAYIIAYGGREDNPGKARRYALRAKNWLAEWRGIDPKRIVVIDGGRREEFIVELWLANDARPPAPTPTVTLQDDLGDNLLYDGFDVGYDNFGNRAEDVIARLDGFAAALKKESNSWGCIIGYAQSGDDRMGMEWDSPGTALKIAQSQKNYLTKRHGFAPSKLTAVDGGYSGRVVELWIMRPNARFDKGPFLYPSRLKASRNGDLTINNSDPLNLCCKACMKGQRDPYILRNGKRVKPK